MRLFIAIDIPEDVRKKLVSFQEKIGNEHARIKWVEADNIHLTLKFLGEVGDDTVGEIRESLKKIKFKSFTSAISGLGVFPNENYVRVIWAGMEPEKKIEAEGGDPYNL